MSRYPLRDIAASLMPPRAEWPPGWTYYYGDRHNMVRRWPRVQPFRSLNGVIPPAARLIWNGSRPKADLPHLELRFVVQSPCEIVQARPYFEYGASNSFLNAPGLQERLSQRLHSRGLSDPTADDVRQVLFWCDEMASRLWLEWRENGGSCR